MNQAVITRTPRCSLPMLSLVGDITLLCGRVHEICGRARRSLAMMLANAQTGNDPVFWVTSNRGTDTLNPDGMASLMSPGRVVFLTPGSDQDALWVLEETLRTGQVPLIVADLPEPPGLTAVRRLHLAARAGQAHGPTAPLGLLLTPGEGGAPGIETRWQMEPAHEEDGPQWQITRLRARMAPPRTWTLRADARGLRLAA